MYCPFCPAIHLVFSPLDRVWRGRKIRQDHVKKKAWPSLVPNSSFDCLQQVREIWSHVMTTGKRRLDRQGELPDHCNSKLCVDQPQVYQTLSCIDAAFQILQASTQLITVSSSWQDITRRALRFLIWHCSLCVCLPLCHTTIHTQDLTRPPRLSPPFLLSVSNQNWRQGRTGNEAKAVSVAMYSGFDSTFCLLQH